MLTIARSAGSVCSNLTITAPVRSRESIHTCDCLCADSADPLAGAQGSTAVSASATSGTLYSSCAFEAVDRLIVSMRLTRSARYCPGVGPTLCSPAHYSARCPGSTLCPRSTRPQTCVSCSVNMSPSPLPLLTVGRPPSRPAVAVLHPANRFHLDIRPCPCSWHRRRRHVQLARPPDLLGRNLG